MRTEITEITPATVKIPTPEDPSTWAEQLDDQQARLETVFKSQLVKGNLPTTKDDPTWCFQHDLEIQRRSFTATAQSRLAVATVNFVSH
jgi:hypothetical protein